ncbi:MAG: hypothetical protein F6K19_12280 [Cyanothece sp. SIO1E1]|nr:hypothetical protein [Cyanothece sp. SIO1E1]
MRSQLVETQEQIAEELQRQILTLLEKGNPEDDEELEFLSGLLLNILQGLSYLTKGASD